MIAENQHQKNCVFQKWLPCRRDGGKRLILSSKAKKNNGYLSQSLFDSQPIIVEIVKELIYKCVRPRFKVVYEINTFEIETESSFHSAVNASGKIVKSWKVLKFTKDQNTQIKIS